MSMAFFNRRCLLQGAAAVAAASVLPRSAWASPLGLPVGIQLYSVREPLADKPQETLAKLYAIGYREVECAGYGTHTIAEYAMWIREAGLKCPSAHLQFAYGKENAPLFADAHTLGAQYATSSSMFPPHAAAAPIPAPRPAPGFGAALGPDGFKLLAEWMGKLGREAKAAGLQYAYHNHSHEFEILPSGEPGYDFLLKNTDATEVKFEIDCGWMSVAGHSPADYMKRYPGRFRMLHIKDFVQPAAPFTTAGSAARPKGTELGRGYIDYKPVFEAARRAGVEHVFAEQEFPFAVSQIDSAQVDYNFLQTFR